jgi:hypothetical protein
MANFSQDDEMIYGIAKAQESHFETSSGKYDNFKHIFSIKMHCYIQRLSSFYLLRSNIFRYLMRI